MRDKYLCDSAKITECNTILRSCMYHTCTRYTQKAQWGSRRHSQRRHLPGLALRNEKKLFWVYSLPAILLVFLKAVTNIFTIQTKSETPYFSWLEIEVCCLIYLIFKVMNTHYHLPFWAFTDRTGKPELKKDDIF